MHWWGFVSGLTYTWLVTLQGPLQPMESRDELFGLSFGFTMATLGSPTRVAVAVILLCISGVTRSSLAESPDEVGTSGIIMRWYLRRVS